MGYYATCYPHFVLVVTSLDMEGLELFTWRFFHTKRDKKGFKTTVVIDRA